MPPDTHRSVLIIVPEESALFEAVGVADIFHRANVVLGEEGPAPPYRVSVAASVRHRVAHGSSGLNLLADSCLTDLAPTAGWDTLIVTGRGSNFEETAGVAAWVAQAAPHCRRVVSVCAGALVLAEAGVLDGRRATTHWKTTAELAKRYPRIRVEMDAIYIKDGAVWTSAGASSGFDLALALVEEDLGARVAREVAQYLVMFLRRPGGQSQFSRFLMGQAAGSGPIQQLQAWALENLDSDLDVDTLAGKAAMSPRNFARVFTRETGTSPGRFVEQIRLEAARQRLEQGRESLDEVAAACGLGNALNLRRTFEKHLGVTPTEYRSRFGMI
jgi:transcriptional regulator GlxA family with amidase domain